MPVSLRRDDFRSLSDMVDLPTIAVLALPNVVPFDLVLAGQIFGYRTPGSAPAYYRMLLCGVSPGLVTMAGGVPIGVPLGLEALQEAETVVVAGLDDVDTPAPESALAALRAAAARGARMVSICTGAFVLGEAGVLDNHRATTHWAYAERLATRFPKTRVDPRVLYVDDRGVMTSAGMAAGIDLCLHIVRRDHGAEAANTIARRMVVAPHRDGGQAQFIEQPVPVTRDSTLQRIQTWALERLAEPLTVDDLARHANTSARHLTRRFNAELGTTPLKWLQRERVRLAQRLLEQTELPVQRIAERAGFGSAIALRRQFMDVVGTTPARYRATFRGAATRQQRGQGSAGHELGDLRPSPNDDALSSDT
jgi:AraC family transcriptional activator FtrA